MSTYELLRFAHIVGFITLGGGLLAVFVAELRAYRTEDVHVFAEAAWYTATCYDGLVVPGALLVGLSGLLLVFELGLGFFGEPWLTAMWALFLFEVIEGNTLTRIQFRRTLRRSRAALAEGRLSDEVRADARAPLGQIAHFLDLPLLAVIVYCGAVRPDRWSQVLVALLAALVVAAVLSLVVPRLSQAGRGSSDHR